MRHVLQQSLNSITTGHPVFEDDQVLTAGQLNDLADYLNDEIGLTRVRLLGVGIVCGLQVSLQSGGILLSQGLGVTSGGGLIRIEGDTLYTSFKPYGETAPDYPPFFSDRKRIPAFELVRIMTRDDLDLLAVPLELFPAQTGRALADMVAVLLLESYEKDDDLCSGTDCDNLGREAVSSVRLVLIDRADAAPFVEDVPTPARGARLLSGIAAERPAIQSTSSTETLRVAYYFSCQKIYENLWKALVEASASPFLAGLLPPGRDWITRLGRLQRVFSAQSLSALQYYYDFLKDVADTYNAFLDLLFGCGSVCCPDVLAFPNHLLLGGVESREPRTGFYPSPLAGCAAGDLDHARFLGWKLAALIDSFRPPGETSQPIRITPSFCEDRSLEERAIPFYYDVAALLGHWNWTLERRGMSDYCYSYHAESYEAKGGAASPFTTQIGRFPFFRIEGAVGVSVASAKTLLEEEIRKNNLPICVRAVLLGADKKNVVTRSPWRYTDLHRFHQILRQDMVYQLDDTVRFGANFKQEVFRAVDAGIVNNESGSSDAPTVKAVADQSNNTLSAKASKAKDKLNLPYAEYVQDLSWKTDVKDTLKASGEFKANLGKIVKTEFQTPIDTLIGSSHVNWLNWMDVIIADQDDKEVERLLFGKFLEEHPGLEHFAGVTRGGTFVLVYDEKGIVVADFMLPYFCCEPAGAEPAEPTLPKPDIKPNWIRDNGISIQASMDSFVNAQIDNFRNEIDPKIKKQLDVQKDYFQVFRDSVSLMDNVYTNIGRTTTEKTPQGYFADNFLNLVAQETDVRNQKVNYLRGRVLEPDLPADKRAAYETQLKNTEMELSRSIEDTVRYVSSTGMDVKTGSEGFRALTLASDSLTRLADPDAVATAKERLTQLSNTTAKQDFKLILGGMITRKRV